jgi:HPt (histidine-containing phosphotransfer) domain-containing protein
MTRIDRTSIAELQSSMGDSFAQLAQYFVEDMLKYRDQLVEAYAAERLDEARRIAHTVKSTSLLFGGRELSVQAKQLEDAFTSGESIPDRLRTFDASIIDHVEQVRQILPSVIPGRS